MLSSVSCPYTLEFERIKPVIEFLTALARQQTTTEPTTYRAGAEKCARLVIEHRKEVVDRIYRGEDRYGQTIEELEPGWFKFRRRISDLPSGSLPTGAVFYAGKHITIVPARASGGAP